MGRAIVARDEKTPLCNISGAPRPSRRGGPQTGVGAVASEPQIVLGDPSRPRAPPRQDGGRGSGRTGPGRRPRASWRVDTAARSRCGGGRVRRSAEKSDDPRAQSPTLLCREGAPPESQAGLKRVDRGRLQEGHVRPKCSPKRGKQRLGDSSGPRPSAAGTRFD